MALPMAYDFDKIAKRYDFMNRLMTLGLDLQWRRRAALAACGSEAEGRDGRDALDVACGTGDMAAALCDCPSRFHVQACDISEEMLVIARRRHPGQYMKADVQQLPYPNECFSVVSCAFGVRNFVDLEAGVREMVRVLRTGGRMVILELSTPDSPLLSPLYSFYTRLVIPLLGKWIGGNKEAYTYLPKSIEQFPKGEAFMTILRQMGCKVEQQKLTLGVCRLYVAHKP